MSREQREHYLVSATTDLGQTVLQVNRILGMLADRLDRIEGLRSDLVYSGATLTMNDSNSRLIWGNGITDGSWRLTRSTANDAFIIEKLVASKWEGVSIFTDIGGMGGKLRNKTGAASVKGSVICASDTHTNAFNLCADEYDCIGIVYDSGVPNDGEAWIIFSGIAEVLLKDGTAATVGYWTKTSATDGRAEVTTAPSSIGAIAANEHFKEIGHCFETKAAGTNVLAKIALHTL